MTCNHCVQSVTKALETVQGVESGTVDLDKGSAAVKYDNSLVSLEQLTQVVQKTGYGVG